MPTNPERRLIYVVITGERRLVKHAREVPFALRQITKEEIAKARAAALKVGRRRSMTSNRRIRSGCDEDPITDWGFGG